MKYGMAKIIGITVRESRSQPKKLKNKYIKSSIVLLYITEDICTASAASISSSATERIGAA